MSRCSLALGMCLAFLVIDAASAQQILRREPARGALRPGESVLVDDGRCPRGQVTQVSAGRGAGGAGMTRAERQRRCVPRPR